MTSSRQIGIQFFFSSSYFLERNDMEDQEVCLLQIQMQTQYIEIYLRQRLTMRQEILHVF